MITVNFCHMTPLLTVIIGSRRHDAGRRCGRRRATRVALAACTLASGHPAPDPGRLAPFTRARDLEAAVFLLGLASAGPAG
jgi:hypothetical protein